MKDELTKSTVRSSYSVFECLMKQQAIVFNNIKTVRSLPLAKILRYPFCLSSLLHIFRFLFEKLYVVFSIWFITVPLSRASCSASCGTVFGIVSSFVNLETTSLVPRAPVTPRCRICPTVLRGRRLSRLLLMLVSVSIQCLLSNCAALSSPT